MNTHTPCPWTIEYDHATNAPELIRAFINNEMYDIASVLCDETNNADENARLIAAAPDLLEALFLALPYVESVLDDPEQLACFKAGTVQRDVKAIRSAISKATGETL